MPKVVVASHSFSRLARTGMRMLEERGYEVEVAPEGPMSEEEFVKLLSDADGVILGTQKFSRRVVEACPRLKVISRHGVRVDNVDVQAARELGVVVTNTPHVYVSAVADFTVGLIVAAARRIVEAHESVKSGGWERPVGRSVYGRTLGVVGTGRVGAAVIRRMRGFAMSFLAFDIEPRSELSREFGVRYVHLDELLRRSDFVTIHVPLTERTRGLIGERELRMMKPTATLVNTSRGGVVDEKALYKALKEGWIAGAALDVFEKEPLRNSPLLELPNLVLTSHIGSYTEECLEEMSRLAAENLISVLEEERPPHMVNPEVWARRRR